MPAALQPVRLRELLGDVRAQRLDLLALRALAGQEALRHAHGAQRPRARVGRQPALHAHELHRPAADVERDSVRQHRRVDGGQVAVAGLLLAREHAHLEPGPFACGVQEVRLVGGVADRRGRDGPDVLDARGAAEVRVELERLQRALHRLVGERAVGLEAGADPHRLVDLVRAPPPRAAGLVRLDVAEHDEPEGIGPEVDDGELDRPAHRRDSAGERARSAPPRSGRLFQPLLEGGRGGSSSPS
jgi:hypothetical protein